MVGLKRMMVRGARFGSISLAIFSMMEASLSLSSSLDIFLLSVSSTSTRTFTVFVSAFSPSAGFFGGRRAMPTMYLSNFSVIFDLKVSSVAMISLRRSWASLGSLAWSCFWNSSIFSWEVSSFCPGFCAGFCSSLASGLASDFLS